MEPRKINAAASLSTEWCNWYLLKATLAFRWYYQVRLSSLHNNDPAYGVASNATQRVLGGQGEVGRDGGRLGP